MTPEAALRGIRRRMGLALRARVAGEHAATQAERIWGASGARWFDATDPIWRVHADAAMFPGGIASLLLQSLHPLAMAGVAGHSGYKGDPWGRLQRTSTYLATTTFGTVADAEEAIEQVRAIHERVRGTDPKGRRYSASDPHLLQWVHVAEVHSFLRAYQTFGPEPLSTEETDTYVAQTAVAATRLGVVDPPTTALALARRLADYRPELEGTPAAREAARFLLLDPPLPLLARPGYTTLAAGGVALLPGRARGMLGLPVPSPLVRLVARPVGAFGTGAVRWAITGLGERRPSDAPAERSA